MQRRVLITFVSALVAVLIAGLAVAGTDDDKRIERKIVIKGDLGWFGPGTYLGVHLTELTPELRAHFGVPEDAGVMVSRVVADSPADRAGIRVGDILTRVGGEDAGSAMELQHLIREREAGETVDLEVFRDGRIETVSATLEEHEGVRMPGHRRMFVGHDFDCGEGDCEVHVDCDGEDCECTRNGEAIDCEELSMYRWHHGEHRRHGEHRHHGEHHPDE